MTAVLGLAACSSSKKSTTPTTSSVLTIGGCQIRPGSNCAADNLSGANLTGARLAGANLATANLGKANLTDADLSGANLTAADLAGATLVNTDLSGANLTKANFTGATLQNANLTDAERCATIRTDGSIDNDDCPERASRSGATTGATSTTTPSSSTTAQAFNLPCTSQTFVQLVQSQGTQFNLSSDYLKGITPGGTPRCASTFATQLMSGPANETGPKSFTALFAAMADRAEWQLVGIQGCSSPGVSLPSNQASQIC